MTHTIDDVSVFFKQTYGKWNWTISKTTTWRGKEKIKWKKEIETKALEKAKKAMINQFKIPKEQLLSMKSLAVKLLMKKMNDYLDKTDKDWNIISEWEKVNVRDVTEIIKTVKIELQEPIMVSKTFNANLEWELDPEEERKVQELLEENL